MPFKGVMKLDELNFITVLQMKRKIRTQQPESKWKITKYFNDHEIYLDDGGNSFFTFSLDEDKYSKEDVAGIAEELALFLGIECNFPK